MSAAVRLMLDEPLNGEDLLAFIRTAHRLGASWDDLLVADGALLAPLPPGRVRRTPLSPTKPPGKVKPMGRPRSAKRRSA